ncbi:hypothetical protein D0C36_13305 [Mucilaginibacter conchicola]|uniref:Adhesin domain-containing protein n=1 Tax=Mucilaginibacter conchicola TaxID=2303333 RepID=A0A372NU26_9SPHI|nr:hypothetical protein [Mucilaginibacter conchicola]RFZ92401.1 hypothetical protein D0C36_13305 [Mucilaginibacter conchicola]
MKKAFNIAFIAIIAVLAAGSGAHAQVNPPEPPLPPENLNYNKDFNSAEFNKSMAKLNTKMADLSKKMAKLSAEQSKKMNLTMKDFNKKFSAQFKDFDKNFNKDFGKDFGKDFSDNFNNLIPQGSFNFDNGNKLSDEEYRRKVASGEITEKTKTYSKSYSVDGNDVLQISNQFGKIHVNTWNKNEFKVDVTMKFSSADASLVDEMLEGTSIIDSKNGSVVSFRTKTWSNQHGRNNTQQDMSIDYNVYMPAGNALDITNRFGSVTLPNLSGKTTLKLQFGSLTAQQLTNAQNNVSIKFSKDNPSTIAFYNGEQLKVEFSKFKVGTIDNSAASFSFSDVSIDKLKTSADINVKFGDGLSIAGIDKSVKNLNINASNTKIDLDFNQSFNFDITTRLGSFNFDEDKVKVTAKTPTDEEKGWSQTKTYKGYVGKNNSGPNVVVTARFADIQFK